MEILKLINIFIELKNAVLKDGSGLEFFPEEIHNLSVGREQA